MVITGSWDGGLATQAAPFIWLSHGCLCKLESTPKVQPTLFTDRHTLGSQLGPSICQCWSSLVPLFPLPCCLWLPSPLRCQVSPLF